MSAIFGIIDFEGRPIDPEWIKSMQTDLAHRGPDGQGLYQEESVVLGHMLLHVTPESVYDKSPYEEDDLVITAYARLDEREAIMERLEVPLIERETITDPHLLLRSFKKFGKGFIKDIYGDFAFAIWDKEKKELFCARDQMGVKPFLYYFLDNRFIFSTEMRAIVKLPIVKTEIDHIYLRDRAIEAWGNPEDTPWKNIYRIKAATWFEIKKDHWKEKKYWTPRYKRSKKYKTEEETAIAVREMLEKIIADHTRVTGKVGAPLSGGFDSSSIICLAARKLGKEGKRIATVSSVYEPGYEDPEEPDEMQYIQSVLDQEKNIDPDFVYHSDLSFINGMEEKFNKHFVPVNGFFYVDEALFDKLNKRRVRRVLSGYLGDYTVSNWSINPLPLLFLSGRIQSFFKLVSKLSETQGRTKMSIIKSRLIFDILPPSVKKLYYRKWGNELNPWDISTFPLNFQGKEKKVLQKKVLRFFKTSNFTKGGIMKQIWPQEFDLFEEDWECASANHQLELTFPFADRRLVELLGHLPIENFWAGGLKRGLIKKTMNGILPEKILKRGNKGLYSPGYSNILINEIPKIIEQEHFFHLDVDLKDLINIEVLKEKFNFILKNSKNTIFAYKDWVIISMFIWILFEKLNTNTLFAYYEKNLD